MNTDFLAWLWYIIGAGVVLLAIAIGYVQWMSRKAPQDPASQQARDEATRLHYRGK
jgi:type IV secretory pathway TrbD component